ncbi:MAG TPA: peptidyl-prolyl cis-trans isomerase [Nitrospirota bacterium]|nr:peptidyl-prolyl cis-trans isomerase [Nitrospirota bacterium]
MKHPRAAIAVLLLPLLFFIATPCSAADQELPAKSGINTSKEKNSDDGAFRVMVNIPLFSPAFSDVPVAMVDDDVITVEDLTDMINATHEERFASDLMEKTAEEKTKKKYETFINRIIDLRLIAHEARNIGFDEDPEYRESVAVFSRNVLPSVLMHEIIQDVTADEKEVDKTYRATSGEWKIRVAQFGKKEDALRFTAALEQGVGFSDAAKNATQDKTAKVDAEASYVKTATMIPQIASAVTKMEKGSVSPVITALQSNQTAYYIVSLEDIRIPDDPAAREKIKKQVLIQDREKKGKLFREGLYKKYVKLNSKLIKSIDYEAQKPGLQKLRKDDRILADISGEKPVRVKDLTKALEDNFYHGIEQAMQAKEVNGKKQEILNNMIDKMLYLKEAKLRGFDRSKQYLRLVREYEQGLLFGLFITKVIAPPIKLSDDEVRKYYNDHIAEYSFPAMVKIDGQPFNKMRDAEAALEKLKKGADFSWIKANADGRTDEHAENILDFANTVLTMNELPGDFKKVLTGARPGDFKIGTGPDSRFYVIAVLDVMPESKRPYEEILQSIAQKVFDDKISKNTADYVAKLRESADIKIYLASYGKK